METIEELKFKLKDLEKEVEITKKQIESYKNGKYIPETKEELKTLANNERISLADIDVSKVDDFTDLFYDSPRKNWQGIETWDVSHVKCMEYMFEDTYFDGDLSNWNLESLDYARGMFRGCDFKGKLPKNFNEIMARLYVEF